MIKINLKGINSSSVISVKASDYISNLLSTYEPLIIVSLNMTIYMDLETNNNNYIYQNYYFLNKFFFLGL